MRSPLSQSQLGIYYACVNNKDEKVNYRTRCWWRCRQSLT